ncbi:Ldh family oxidoreductase [soil metagenome]
MSAGGGGAAATGAATCTVSHRDAVETSLRALTNAGVPPAHAALQVDLLVEGELWNHPSHGLLRLPRVIERIHNGVCDPTTSGVMTWRSDTFLEVDGLNGLGPVVATAAIEAASERARKHGVAIAAIRNNNHLGMLGWYAHRIAKSGLIVIAATTSEALVHPWGGRKAMLGTNPIAVGVPCEPHPGGLDMATSLISMGQVHDHAHRGEPLQPGWALDADGEPTTNASAARHGAIAPFGGAKGYALGLGLELLVTSLTGAAIGTDVQGTLDSTNVCNKGDLFIVVDPTSSASTAAAVAAYLDALRHSPPADPRVPVSVPGDRAQASRTRRLADGFPIAESVWNRITELAGPRP